MQCVYSCLSNSKISRSWYVQYHVKQGYIFFASNTKPRGSALLSLGEGSEEKNGDIPEKGYIILIYELNMTKLVKHDHLYLAFHVSISLKEIF